MAEAQSDILVDTHVRDVSVSDGDRQVLRRLAGRVAELAAREIEQEKRRLWMAHNDLVPGTRPLVVCDPENGWNEIITGDSLQCRGELARHWEWMLRKDIFWTEEIRDDRVVEPYFNLADIYTRTGWGLRETYTGGAHGGAKTWDAPVKDLDHLEGLHFQEITVDRPATQRLWELAQDVLGDLLPLRRRNGWYWTLGLTWELIKLRGLEQMMLDMYDNAAGLHRLMAFLRDGTMRLVDQLERDGLYTLNNEGDGVGSGGFGWTSHLPAEGYAGTARANDLWCLAESQETVGVSPEMFEEFVFAYQLPIMKRFGLVCYGCCEPVHMRWHIIRRIPNLRRVSVSPWCDRAAMAENLRDEYVYSLKPHPAPMAGANFEEEALRADIRDGLAKARGCRLECIMKDTHTLGRDPTRPGRWVELVREELARANL